MVREEATEGAADARRAIIAVIGNAHIIEVRGNKNHARIWMFC